MADKADRKKVKEEKALLLYKLLYPLKQGRIRRTKQLQEAESDAAADTTYSVQMKAE